MTAPATRSLIRRLEPVAGLAVGLRSLGAALAALPIAIGQLRRVEIPLTVNLEALDLPAGFPSDALDPLTLLGCNWSGAGAVLDRDLASLAALDEPSSWLEALGWPAGGPDLRFALSARFDPDRTATSEWADFGGCRAWLPALELDTTANILALNWLDRDQGGESRQLLLAALARWRPRSRRTDRHQVTWRTDPADRPRWCSQVESALARIADTATGPPLEKIVLARRLDGIPAANLHPTDLLCAGDLGTVGWPWWIQRRGSSWLGESPELLGAREGSRLRTVALAGTRVRDVDPARDEALGKELLASDKDRREQAAVADWMQGQLTELSAGEPSLGDLELARLPSLQHLSRSLEATVASPHVDGRWLDALHPTPAICGAPRAHVRRWLREAESFDRGLYGGVVGWLQRSRAEVYVGIRGVLLSERRVSVYAGAGLVRGSNPRLEWAESGAKLGAICNRLGLQPPREEAHA